MQTAAVLVLADAGLGADAEAGLRHVLADLAAPSPAAVAALRRLGLRPADVDPSLESLVDVFRRLDEAGLDEDAARDVFGERGAPVALALARRVERLAALQRG